MRPPIHLEKAGGQWYHTEDYHSPNLSKASLGEFMAVSLSAGAYIGHVWPFAPKCPRSSVFFTVYMTPEIKTDIESKTKFRFKNPPKIKLNSSAEKPFEDGTECHWPDGKFLESEGEKK